MQPAAASVNSGIVPLLFILLFLTHLASSNYSLTINVHSISNRGGRCADEHCALGEECCESATCVTTICNYYLKVCLMTPTEAAQKLNNRSPVQCSTYQNSTAQAFERSWPVDNSFTFTGNEWIPNGHQLFIELLHLGRNFSVLIDRYTVNLTMVPGGDIPRTPYQGHFQLSRIEMSTTLVCTLETCGVNCDIQNATICKTCLPGFGGTHCSINIDDCAGVTCDRHMTCMDELNMHSCMCLPGYTSQSCSVDINECLEDSACNFNGKCINELGSYSCECDSEHTGQFCESTIDRYVVEIKFHRFYHEFGKCADNSRPCNNGTGCCDSESCFTADCNYMFLYCPRFAFAPVSRARSENRGSCTQLQETQSVTGSTKVEFFGNVYGMPNPITLTEANWPKNGIQFYIELLDDDSMQREERNNELIDRFVFNISENVTKGTYIGMFGLVELTLSITIKCSVNFYGENCENFCRETCNPSDAHDDTGKETAIASALSILGILLIVSVLAVTFCIGGVLRYKMKVRKVHASQPEVVVNEDITTPSHVVQHGPQLSRTNTNTYEQITLSSNIHDLQLLPPPNSPMSPTSFNSNVTRYPFALSNKNKNCSSFYSNCTSPMKSPSSLLMQGSPLLLEVQDWDSTNDDTYDYAGRHGKNGDVYDYEIPYWKPSNEKTELLSQITKLRLTFIPNEHIQELDEIGKGEFGIVSRALWIPDYSNSPEVKEKEVAVKTLKVDATDGEKIKFLQEAAIMGQFCHPNICRILGLVSVHEIHQYKIILEYMNRGSMRDYLPSLKGSFQKLSSQLLSFSRQIANGMTYLELKGCVHRDLAARNILVSDDEVCKIGDFGLSRELQSEAFYLAHGGKIPIKWAAPEAVNYRLWSTASDVWSYGCVLYEIWSLGYKPFHNTDNKEAIAKLVQGYRLPPPPGCPRAIYQIMIDCWNVDSEARPSFSKILLALNQPEYKITKWSLKDKEKYCKEARTIGEELSKGSILYEELQNTYYF